MVPALSSSSVVRRRLRLALGLTAAVSLTLVPVGAQVGALTDGGVSTSLAVAPAASGDSQSVASAPGAQVASPSASGASSSASAPTSGVTASTGVAAAGPGAGLLPAGAPAAVPGDLLSVVPANTASVMTWRSGPDTQRLESELGEVADAVLAARFDRFAFDAMEDLGAPPELVTELSAIRNLLTTVGAVVPWEELISNEVVYCETPQPAMLPGTDTPSMLLACRPDPARLESIESGLAAVLGALSGTIGTSVRYDIEVDAAGTTIYEITMRAEGDPALLQVAVHDDMLLMGLGEEYFRQTLDLARGEGGTALMRTPRFRRAFGELGHDAPGRSFFDVQMSLDGFEDSSELLADHAFNAGFWPSLVNDALQLGSSLDTVAGTLRCQGDRVVTDSITRFLRSTPQTVLSGLPRSATSGLLDYVPADASALTMRGQVDLVPSFRWATDQFRKAWGPAADVLWFGQLTGAAMDLQVERDVLPWLGAEHVSMTLPSRRGGGGSDSVMLARVTDRHGARTCLNRIDGVLGLTLPKLVGQLRQWTEGNEQLAGFDARLVPADGLFRNLKRLEIDLPRGLPLPIQIPAITYGLMGDLLIVTTSEDALSACLAVAAGEEDGLYEHPLLGEQMLAGGNVSSVSLHPLGAEMAQTVGMVDMVGGMLRGTLSAAGQNDPQMAQVAGVVDGLLGRLQTIAGTIDFLGDVMTVESSRDDGLARFETTTYELVDPTGRWSRPAGDETLDAVTRR